jgi:hypothetical protein
MTPSRLFLAGFLAVSGCGPSEPNPPTAPSQPIDTPEAAAPLPKPPPGVGSVLPGTGPQSFVGRWAANVAWCPNTQGPERPIEITTDRFEGYENSCAIAAVDQVDDGYEATLACAAEGTNTTERVRMSVAGQAMRLTWLNREGAVVSLTKCTRLDDTPPA